MFGDAVTRPGSCPASSPIQFAAPVAWRASAPLGGCGLVTGRGVMLRGGGSPLSSGVPAHSPAPLHSVCPGGQTVPSLLMERDGLTPVRTADSKCTERSLCARLEVARGGRVRLPPWYLVFCRPLTGWSSAQTFCSPTRAGKAAAGGRPGGQGQLAGGALPAPEPPKQPSSWC